MKTSWTDTRVRRASMVFIALATLLAVGPGHGAVIKGYQKISNLHGGFAQAGGRLERNDDFGESLAAIGDLDGDGVNDLVVGAQRDDDTGEDRGAVYVLFLNPNGTVKALQKISASSGGFTGVLDDIDYFGKATAGLGDIDDDGIPDIAVSAMGDDDGPGDNNGAVYILFMNRDGTVRAHQKISEEQGNLNQNVSNFGEDVSRLGDLNQDGVEDMLVAESGGVRIVYLNANGTVKSSRKFSGSQFNNGTLLGDLNNDGVMDIAVGAPNDNDGGTRRGAVWIIYLNANGTEQSRTKISSTQGGFTGLLEDFDEFGQAVAGAGDLNNDGIPDLIVGAEHADAPYCTDPATCTDVKTGEVWILHLNRNGTVQSHQLITSQIENFLKLRRNSNLGQAVAFMGDLDGDTIGDIVAAADGDIDGASGPQVGSAYVLFLAGTVPPPGNRAPVLAPIGNQVIGEGDLLVIAVSATDSDGPVPLRLSVVGAPAGSTFTDFGGGMGEFRWTPDSGAAAGSPYGVTFRATDNNGNGLAASETVSITVVPPGSGGGSLSGTTSVVGNVIDLSALGSADWTHWKGGTPALIRRDGTAQISDFVALGGETPTGAGSAATYIWNNGTPVANGTATDALRVFNTGSGFRVTSPAGTASRTLRMYVGAKNARSALTARLSDGSASPLLATIDQTSGLATHVVTLSYRSASDGQTLIVEYTLDMRYRSGLKDSQINLESAALTGPSSGGPPPPPPSAGTLSGVRSVVTADVDLTAVGAADWTHWKGGTTPLIRKSSGFLISNYNLTSTEQPVGAGSSARYLWSDGTPVTSSSASDAVRVFEIGSGFVVTAPADGTLRTLRMYVGAKSARGRLTATLSDGSAPAFTTLVDQPSGLGTHLITLDYRASAPGQLIRVEYTLDTRYESALKNSQINLESAALAP